jgi:hypothetical protein
VKIPNPWPWHPLSRCTCRTEKGDVVCVGSSRDRELEVPDADEVLIEPVKHGIKRGEVEPIGQGRIWSRRWGLLDIEDHVKKQQIEIEEAELREKQKRQRDRDKERDQRAKKEKPAKVVSEKPSNGIGEKSVSIDTKLDMGSTLEL